MGNSVIAIEVSKLAIKLYQNLLFVSLFYFSRIFARVPSFVDRKGLGKCGWTVCDILYDEVYRGGRRRADAHCSILLFFSRICHLKN